MRSLEAVSFDVGGTLLSFGAPGFIQSVRQDACLDDIVVHRLCAALLTTEVSRSGVIELLGEAGLGAGRYESPVGTVFADVERALASVSVPMVTVSNVSSMDCQPLPANLSRYFESSFNSCEIGVAKPNPAVFDVVEGSSFGLRPSVHVGDSPRCDVAAASAAGVAAVLVSRHKGLSGPLRIAPDVVEIGTLDDLDSAFGLLGF